MFFTAQFWWLDQLSNLRWISRTPAAVAISTERSVLNESSTTTSSLHLSESRQRCKLISSLRVRTSTETGTGTEFIVYSWAIIGGRSALVQKAAAGQTPRRCVE